MWNALMELSHTLIEAIWRPHFVFKFSTLQLRLTTSPESAEGLSWDSSSLNPKNRINSLDETATWRMDGATVCGTHFFVVPTCILPRLIPLRLDLYIPDQNAHPPLLRESLDSSLSAPLRDLKIISKLGISRHLCRALDSHCRRHKGFFREYLRSPFATRLVFDKIEADVEKMNLALLPWHEIEQQSKSIDALQTLWERDLPRESWPEAVSLEQLRLVEQLHDSVSVVCLAPSSNDLFAFKSTVENVDFVYHELKFLLTIPPHPNIMPRPRYIVTKRSLFGGKRGVVGFLLPYFPLGSIRDLLPARSRENTLLVSDQLKWCIQITSALLHVLEQGGTFYSDLRPDNVLLATTGFSEGQNTEYVVLCDFEQRGNWHEWCAPEVLYRQYVENIRGKTTSTKPGTENHWHKLIEAYSSVDSSYRNEIEVKNCAWFGLSPASQEKAMVYSLGLFIYCIFEGLSNVRVNIANAYRYEPDIEFPVFLRTPPAIQSIIRQCTIDAPEWPDNAGTLTPPRANRVTRIRDRLYGANYQALNCKRDMIEDVLQTGLKWWETELERAKNFLNSEAWISQNFGRQRPDLQTVLSALEHVNL